MRLHILSSRRLTGLAALACVATLMPVAALAATVSPAASSARPVTAYVVNTGSIARATR